MRIFLSTKIFVFLSLLITFFSQCRLEEVSLDQLSTAEIEQVKYDAESKRKILQQEIESNRKNLNEKSEELKQVKEKLELVDEKIEEVIIEDQFISQKQKYNWKSAVKIGAMITILTGVTAATGGATAYVAAEVFTQYASTTLSFGATKTVVATIASKSGLCSVLGSVVGGAIGLEGGMRSVDEHGAVTLSVAARKTCEAASAGTFIGTAGGGNRVIDGLLLEKQEADKQKG